MTCLTWFQYNKGVLHEYKLSSPEPSVVFCFCCVNISVRINSLAPDDVIYHAASMLRLCQQQGISGGIFPLGQRSQQHCEGFIWKSECRHGPKGSYSWVRLVRGSKPELLGNCGHQELSVLSLLNVFKTSCKLYFFPPSVLWKVISTLITHIFLFPCGLRSSSFLWMNS